jgi:hypothetical protein
LIQKNNINREDMQNRNSNHRNQKSDSEAPKGLDRRHFIRTTALAGIGVGMSSAVPGFLKTHMPNNGKRVGIIGLDTSHSIEFAKMLNAQDASTELGGYRVVMAYPQGSRDIEESVKRIAPYTEEIKKYGVAIASSLDQLIKAVDVVLLETNDGRLHLEQALPVIKAKKTLFIDKPMTASLRDAIQIFDAAERNKVPVFSSSSLRYMKNVQLVVSGEMGKVIGAETFSPAYLEPTHPDLFWYGIHGVETLYTVMGTGCTQVTRFHTPDTDLVVGTWQDGRIGTFRGVRSGKMDYGGTAYCEKGNQALGPFEGYMPLLKEIVRFFETGKPPVSAAETLELLAFMEAADESKRLQGAPVSIKSVFDKASRKS